MMNVQRSLLCNVRKSKVKCLGHLVRQNELQKLLLEGKINRRRGKGKAMNQMG